MVGAYFVLILLGFISSLASDARLDGVVWMDKKIKWENPPPGTSHSLFAEGIAFIYLGPPDQFKVLYSTVYKNPDMDSIALSGEGGSWYGGKTREIRPNVLEVTYSLKYSPVRIVSIKAGKIRKERKLIDTIFVSKKGNGFTFRGKRFAAAKYLSEAEMNGVIKSDVEALHRIMEEP